MEEEKKEIKEEFAEEIDVNLSERDEMTINRFMDDMTMLGMQVRNPELKKPSFNYGDASVTNYLLWLLLGEIMILNDKLEETE